jgi:hypothetical protein
MITLRGILYDNLTEQQNIELKNPGWMQNHKETLFS